MTTLERIEQFCTSVFGHGAAVSVNKEDGRWVVRCWDKKGLMTAEVVRLAKETALSSMLSRLKMLDAEDSDEGAAGSPNEWQENEVESEERA